MLFSKVRTTAYLDPQDFPALAPLQAHWQEIRDEALRLNEDGRIRASLPTISALAQAGARVVVCAHLCRPKGAPDPQYSLAPVAARLGELLGADVAFAEDTVGESARAIVDGLADGSVQDAAVLPAVRDGGKVATVRGYRGDGSGRV